jgi:hypothetical protein
MALNPKMADAAANAAADAVARQLDNGYLRIYSGTQPTDADTAIGAQTLLAELRFNATSAPGAANGVLTFNAFTADSSANATGTAAWFRALQSNGTSAVFDGTVGTGTHDLVINSTAIQSGAAVSVSSFTFTISQG